MQELRLDNINRLTKEELRQASAIVLNMRPKRHRRPARHPTRSSILHERIRAQRRFLDFSPGPNLELVVIILIGAELLLGYQQEREQSKAAALQLQVLTNLQATSAATAAKLRPSKWRAI